MKVLSLVVAASVASALAPVEALHAQTPVVENRAMTARAAIVAEQVRGRLDGADRVRQNGRSDAARFIYESIAKDMYAVDLLPAEAVWRLAGIDYADGQALKAAAALDQLATAAAAHRDAVVEAASLLEAATIYHRKGRPAEATERFERGMRVLNSGDVPSTMRRTLLERAWLSGFSG